MRNDLDVRISISPSEMNRLMTLWHFHRSDCDHKGDIKIACGYCAIGTATFVICGCGKEMDITEYGEW